MILHEIKFFTYPFISSCQKYKHQTFYFLINSSILNENFEEFINLLVIHKFSIIEISSGSILFKNP